MVDELISLLSIWASMNSWLTPTYLFLFLNLMIATIFISSNFTSPNKPQYQSQHNVTVLPNQYQQQQSLLITQAPSLIQRVKSINLYSYYSQNPSPISDTFFDTVPELETKKLPAQVQTTAQIVQTTELTTEKLSAQAELTTKKLSAQVQTAELAAKKVFTQPKAKVKTQTQAQIPELDLKKDLTLNWAPAIDEELTDDEGPTIDEIYNKIKGIASTKHNRQNSDTIPMSGEIPTKLPARMKKSASDKSAFNHFVKADESESEMNEREMMAAAMAIAADGGGTEVDARADDFINRFKKQLLLQRNESILQYKDMITRINAM